jgi:hypothetical protein
MSHTSRNFLLYFILSTEGRRPLIKSAFEFGAGVSTLPTAFLSNVALPEIEGLCRRPAPYRSKQPAVDCHQNDSDHANL